MSPHENLPNQNQYIDAVISLYLNLPDTPSIPSFNDKLTASDFFAQQIPIHSIEAALLLASLRRLSRQDDRPPLSPVRSLAYFVPVVQEISALSLPDGYLHYLRLKLRSFYSR